MEQYVEEFIRNASSVDLESPTLTKRDRVIFAKDQVVSTFKKVFPYILVGVGIGAIIHNWIPESWIQAVLGSNNPFGDFCAEDAHKEYQTAQVNHWGGNQEGEGHAQR